MIKLDDVFLSRLDCTIFSAPCTQILSSLAEDSCTTSVLEPVGGVHHEDFPALTRDRGLPAHSDLTTTLRAMSDIGLSLQLQQATVQVRPLDSLKIPSYIFWLK